MNETKLLVTRTIYQCDNKRRRELEAKIGSRLSPYRNDFGFSLCHSVRVRSRLIVSFFCTLTRFLLLC